MTDNEIRDLLREAATLAPTTFERSLPRRRTAASRVAPVVTTVAVVVALVIAAVFAGGRREATTPGTKVSEGFRTSTFRGLQVTVPESWRDDETACGTPKADTVIHHEGVVCLALYVEPVGLSLVEWYGTERPRLPCTPTGASEITRCSAPDDSEGRLVAVVERRATNTVAVVRSRDAKLLERIALSARAIQQADGCNVRLQTLDVTEPQRADTFVPEGPNAVTVCRYTGLVLERSATVGQDQARAYAAALNRLSAGLGQAPAADGYPQTGDPRCAAEAGRGFRIRFTYTDHDPWWVTLRLTGCGKVIGFDNGSDTAYPEGDVITLPMRLTGMDASWHDLRTNSR